MISPQNPHGFTKLLNELGHLGWEGMTVEMLTHAKRFVLGDEGSSTIEAVLWLPVFIGFFALVADASLLFFGQNKTYRIVQDANRLLSTGYITSTDEAEAEALVAGYVRTQLSDFAPNASVVSKIDLGQITTEVKVPGSDFVATGLLTAFMSLNIVSRSTHYIEY